MKDSVILEIDNISKTFNPGTLNEVRALRNVSLTIEKGTWVIVIGTNGSGKSTLLNAVAGNFIVDTGKIELSGNDITNWGEHRRAKFIGRVFQNPFTGTAPNMTIAENLSLASKRGMGRGIGMALRKDVLKDLKERVFSLNMGMENRLDNIIGRLSGGQRQALTLLMATWQKPELLLLDEHTAALDPRSANQVIKLTEELVSKNKLTTFMVTHSMHQAVALGDRLIMMHNGRVIHDFGGTEKKRLRAGELLSRFEEVRRREQLDETAAEMLQQTYI